jgi:hypothetical protein
MRVENLSDARQGQGEGHVGGSCKATGAIFKNVFYLILRAKVGNGDLNRYSRELL